MMCRAISLFVFLTLTGTGACQLCGDVLPDGSFDVLDAYQTARLAAGIGTVGAAELAAGDTDGSGTLEVTDALALARSLVGLAAPLPARAPCGSGWREVGVLTSPLTPPARCEGSVATDPVRDRALLFGGLDQSYRVLDDLWGFGFAGSSWQRLSPAGTPPGARAGHEMTADDGRQRLLVFGGTGLPAPGDSDVYALDFSMGQPGRWMRLAAGGTPPLPRYFHSQALSSAGDALVVFGGYDILRTPLDDLWVLDFSSSPSGQWRELQPVGDVPQASRCGVLAADPTAPRFLHHGGCGPGGSTSGELHALELDLAGGRGIFRRLTPSGLPARPNLMHEVVVDTTRARVILVGGDQQNDVLDVLDLSGGGDGAWVQELSPLAPSARRHPVAALSRAGELVLATGVDSQATILGDTWILRTR